MAGPVVTTLLSPNPASGTKTTDGTEQTFASASAASGTYVLRLDKNAMQDGDGVEIRGYNSADASNQRVCFAYPIFNAVTSASELVHVSPPIITADYVKFTITRIAGTDRAYPWSVLNLNGV